MRNLLTIVLRYHLFILFLLLEILAVVILIQNNHFQHSAALNSGRTLASYYYRQVDNFTEYISLRETNRKLATENTFLQNQLPSTFLSTDSSFLEVIDTSLNRHYRYISSRVVNNSINKQYNYITLDKGRRHGVRQGMAVISDQGVIGVVEAVSDHFSLVLSLLNRDFRISAKLLKNNYFGPLEWSGRSPDIANLNEISLHVPVALGDTVVTSGFTSTFPEGIMIGRVDDIKISNGSFYTIRVRLANDFRNLSYVMVVQNLLAEEQLELEERANGND
jgi:rod shape-determining protein MreC